MALCLSIYSVIAQDKQVIKYIDKISSSTDKKFNVDTKIEGDNLIIETTIPQNTFEHLTSYESGSYNIKNVKGGVEQIQKICYETNEYLKNSSNKNLKINIISFGQSDNLKARGSIYNGDLGTIENQSFYNVNEGVQKYETLIPNKNKIWKIDYAYLRGLGI